MANQFDIDYQGKQVPVSYQKGTTEKTYVFTIELAEGPVQLQCSKDSDGAYKWLETDDKASERATDLGTTIEKAMLEKSINL